MPELYNKSGLFTHRSHHKLMQ